MANLRKIDRRKIGDEEYQMIQLPVLLAGKGMLRLSKALGPAALLASEGDVKPATILAALTSGVSDAEYDWFVANLEPMTKILKDSGQPEHPIEMPFRASEAFEGSPGQLFEWLLWGIQHNFSDFLGAPRSA